MSLQVLALMAEWDKRNEEELEREKDQEFWCRQFKIEMPKGFFGLDALEAGSGIYVLVVYLGSDPRKQK